MNDTFAPQIEPAICAHPDCDIVLSENGGHSCSLHTEWLGISIAVCDAGNPTALEDLVVSDPRYPEILLG